MKRNRVLRVAVLAALLGNYGAYGAITPQTVRARTPEKLRLDTVWIADANPAEFVFVINNIIGYKTLESLKTAVANLPPGSTLTWFPRPRGAPRLPPDDGGIADFKTFCVEHKVELIVIPGE